jgi:hypothetical protein
MMIYINIMLIIRAVFVDFNCDLYCNDSWPLIPNPAYLSQKNPGTPTLIIRERIVDGKPLILTGENGRTKKRKIINKGEKDDFQKK